jgi:hypothetical protein
MTTDLAYDGRPLLEEGLSRSERAVLDVLKMAEPCYALWDDIAMTADLSEATVRRAAQGLIGRGIAKRKREDGTGCVGYYRTLAGSPFPGRPGYVTGLCEHAVAGSEWRSGYRNCERCGS